MMNKITVILQKHNTEECRSISHIAAISDDITIIRSSLEELNNYWAELIYEAMPVGSVEFVQEAFSLIGIQQPTFNQYPDFLEYGRTIQKVTVYDAICRCAPVFIKPVELKRFNGFILLNNGSQYCDDYDIEQFNKVMGMKLNDEVWTSDIISFNAEFRVYITAGKVVACCRYDDGESEYIISDEYLSKLESLFPDKTLSVDVFCLDDGKYAVVECNDAWAIGKYQGISDKDYFKFLKTRWGEIIK